MAEAYIYDHVRTPRGRGKPDGSLHEVTASSLAAQTLRADPRPQRTRHATRGRRRPRLRRSGRRGGRRHRARGGADGGLRQRRARHPDQPLLRLRAGRGELRLGAGHVRPAGHGGRGRRGIDEPHRHRRVRRGVAGRPDIAIRSYFMPQGVSADLIATKYGFSRDDVDGYAVESQRRAKAAGTTGASHARC